MSLDPKYVRIVISHPIMSKDSHQIHHHISLSRRVMDKNGYLMAASLSIQDGGQKVSMKMETLVSKSVNGYKSPRVLNENTNSYIVNLIISAPTMKI